MPVINVTKEIVSEGHSFWTLTLPYERGEVIRVYGQSLGQALRNLARDVTERERVQRVREQDLDQVEAA